MSSVVKKRTFSALDRMYGFSWMIEPIGAAVLFGATEALAFRLPPAGGRPFYPMMVPYVLTVVVIIAVRKARAPLLANRL